MSKKTFQIKGKVAFQQLGTGFWGIIDEKGNEWRPTEMPNQLKYEGKQVVITAEEAEEGMSIFMWGTAIDVVAFNT